MDRIWNASKYPLKHFVVLCQIKAIQGHEVKKVIFKISSLSGVIHVFGYDFRHERKKRPLNTFWTSQIWQKLKIRKKAEILVNSVKSDLLGHSKRQNSAVFKDSNFKVCTRAYFSVSFLIHMFRLIEKKLKLSWKIVKKQLILMIIFLILKTFKQFQNLILHFHSHGRSACFVENQFVSSWKLYSWRRFSGTLILERNWEKMTSLWRH